MAMIVDAVVGMLAEKLASLVEEKAVMILGVKDDLARLQRRLARIQPKLEAAERRSIDDKDNIGSWVRELKDVMYDADDIIDLCRLEGARLLDEEPSMSTTSSTQSAVRCHFPFLSCFTSVKLRNEIGERIKSLNDRLGEIVKDYSDFSQFKVEHTAKADEQVSWVSSRRPNFLSGVEPVVVGREIEEATNSLVHALARADDQQRCCVFAITGMGGIGKTTLAQKVYNSQTIKAFTAKAWVCISKDFNKIDQLIRELIRKFGGQLGGEETESELLELLCSVVSGKQFFLVLDDVWDARVWVDLLQVPLQSGGPGSRVLVTTRDDNVGKGMGATIYHVQQLSIKSGWELLCKCAYVSGAEELESLREIGLQIVAKCHGLPLAIKTIGGVLARKEQIKMEWEKILKSHAWSVELPEDLRGALYTSYDSLPPHLKQCFLYFSLFHEDSLFHRDDLVSLWVAEGFVQTKGGSSMEELAEEYFEELMQRNLLQPDPINLSRERCKMHDLLRSLAILLSRDENIFGDAQQFDVTTTTSKLRRLSIAESGEIAVIPESIINQKSLRTLLVFASPPRLGNDLVMRLSFLRVLVLNGSGIESVPDSLGTLVHLRDLNLARTSISSLPASLGNLTNLQFLHLSDCESLNTLPKGITRLCRLRHLNLTDTPLSFVPKGIGRLEQLNVLLGFVVGTDSIRQEVGCGLEELQSLSQLRRLSIHNLERAQLVGAGAGTISNKTCLKELCLNCSVDDAGDADKVQKVERLYEELLPPAHVEELIFIGFIGRGFPSWMMSVSSLKASFSCLRYLGLVNCIWCTQLPQLGELPLLKTLTIQGATAITSIGPEFLGSVTSSSSSSKAFFPKLELLRIQKMPNWEEWSFGPEFDDKGKESLKLSLLPRLGHLIIEDCPRLRALPNGLRHSAVTNLFIRRSHSLRCVGNLPTLTELVQLEDNHSLETVSHLPALKELVVLSCPMLKRVEKVDTLQLIYLADDSLAWLPEWLSALVVPQQQQWQDEHPNFRFDLRCNSRVFERCLEGGADWPIIQKIPVVYVNEIGGDGRLIRYAKKPFSYQLYSVATLIDFL